MLHSQQFKAPKYALTVVMYNTRTMDSWQFPFLVKIVRRCGSNQSFHSKVAKCTPRTLLDTKTDKTLQVVTTAGDAFTPLLQHSATSSALLASRPLIIINSSPDRRTSLAQRVWTWCQELRSRYDHPAPESLIPRMITEKNTAKLNQKTSIEIAGEAVIKCWTAFATRNATHLWFTMQLT